MTAIVLKSSPHKKSHYKQSFCCTDVFFAQPHQTFYVQTQISII